MGTSMKRELVSSLSGAILGLLLSVTVEPWLEDLKANESILGEPKNTVHLSLAEPGLPRAEPEVDGGGRERLEPGKSVKPPPDFNEADENHDGMRWIRQKVVGPNGELAYLEISILDAEHYWPIGRADVILTPGGQEERIFDFLDSSGLAKKIEKAKDIIAIGMASCELDRFQDQMTEESRAEARSHQLINWVRRLGTLSNETQLYAVNLGRFQDPDCKKKSPYQTRLQRNAILVSVVYKEDISIPDLGRLIKAELMNKDRLGLEIEKYSQPGFELRRHN